MKQSQHSTVTDAQIVSAMAAAYSAARRFEGATAPNPPVGCAIINAKGDVIAIAAHARAGEPHAEALAIDRLTQEGRLHDIDTIVVTLEPCNHHGRTPPCSEAILATPAKRVVYGAADPNSVAGGGADRLRAAGISVALFHGKREQLDRLIAPFAKRVTQGLPFVTVKQAINSHGTMIPPKGQKTFTSQGSLVIAHALRRRADAILTGSGTILADDPRFTVRHLPDHEGKERKLMIMDRRNRVPQSYIERATARGFDVSRAVNLEAALRSLAEAGCNEVLVEAGPTITQHVLLSPFWDEHVRVTQTDGEDRVEILTPGGNHVSGIIDRLGRVQVARHEAGALHCEIATGYTDLALGESVAVNGVCLTVASLAGADIAHFFASAETLARTNLDNLRDGSTVNLERAVSLNTRLSGHLVQGHVDGKAVLTSVTQRDGAWLLTVALPKSLARYCVEKGSIALNGISLTINTMQDQPDGSLVIGLTIIPHTWEHTNLHAMATGDNINVEVDVMAKYVERLCKPYT